MKSYLNLGCGNRFHTAWTNIDFVSSDPSVLSHNLRRGIPSPDAAFDVVYHSHLLEHFAKSEALSFLSECRRVLKPEGIIRIAVPDLEQLARMYLLALDRAAAGDEEWERRYQWIMLELLDQTVRERPGGAMAAYLQQEEIPALEFIISRMGREALDLIEACAQSRGKAASRPTARQMSAARLWRGFLRAPRMARERALRLLAGGEYEMLEVGRFRRRGEPHLWMYDRYSLARLLKEAGFRDPQRVGPSESSIPEWSSYNLDTEPDGQVYKPDSLFMEAFK
ncbi:MAG TPA: methyltransferase domain-containing protein [Pyrinomonadaceae bacterium]|jgi:predicted SAM-dependent methyltransferase